MKVVFDIPRHVVETIDGIARENGDSRAGWIRQAIREKLDNDLIKNRQAGKAL